MQVTIPQFRQCVSTKLELQITEAEALVICKKYCHEDKQELINYIAFRCAASFMHFMHGSLFPSSVKGA